MTDAFRAFRAEAERFGATATHWLPDITLLGLLNDLEEHAVAAETVRATSLPHRAYPSARAAFEAAQHALLLATSDDYDRAGARAWLYFLKKDREFSMRYPEAEELFGMSPADRFRLAKDEIAETWDDLAPGKGALVHEMLPVVEQQPRRPDNWAGVSVAPTLAARHAQLLKGAVGDHDPLEVFNNAYAVLNRATHPRASLRPMRIRRDAAGIVHTDFETRELDEDRHAVGAIVGGALNLGSASYRIRIMAS